MVEIILESLGSGTGYLATWAATCGALWKLFSKAEAEDLLQGKLKDQLERCLNPVHSDALFPRTGPAFRSLFDFVFGPRHFSWKCFRRSCTFSLVAATIMTIWLMSGTGFASRHLHRILADPTTPSEDRLIRLGWFGATWFLSFWLPVVIFNFIPDYFSLLDTRWIVRLIETCKSPRWLIIYVIVDLVATTGVFLVLPSMIILLASASPTDFAVLVATKSAWIFGLLKEEGDAVSIFFYSTFGTSVWIWVCVLAGSALRLSLSISAK